MLIHLCMWIFFVNFVAVCLNEIKMNISDNGIEIMTLKRSKSVAILTSHLKYIIRKNNQQELLK